MANLPPVFDFLKGTAANCPKVVSQGCGNILPFYSQSQVNHVVVGEREMIFLFPP